MSLGAMAATLGGLILLAASVTAQDVSPGPSLDPGSSEVALEGNWMVRAFDPRAEGLVEPRAASELTASLLADGTLEGGTGCGTYAGSYHVDGPSIQLSVLARDPQPCGPRAMEEAVGFVEALNVAQAWAATDDGLELLDASGRVRVSLAPAPATGPEGAWLVTSFARPNGQLRSAPDDGSMSLLLGPNGELGGSTGCRLFEGEYVAQSDQILIVPIDLTGLPCDGAVRRAERQLLAAFELVVLWERDGATLRLIDAGAATVLELTADRSPLAPTEPDPRSTG